MQCEPMGLCHQVHPVEHGAMQLSSPWNACRAPTLKGLENSQDFAAPYWCAISWLKLSNKAQWPKSAPADWCNPKC